MSMETEFKVIGRQQDETDFPFSLDPDSALLLAGTSGAVWKREWDDTDTWWFDGLSEYVKKFSGRQCGPRFRALSPVSGAVLYECQLRWGRGSRRIILTSGGCASTREALLTVLKIGSDIPLEASVDWSVQLSNELGFRGMHPPVFGNDVEIGFPAIRCTLVWGSPGHLREVTATGKKSRTEAFQEAVLLALEKGQPEEPKKPLLVKPRNWMKEISRASGGSLISNSARIDFVITPEGKRCAGSNSKCNSE